MTSLDNYEISVDENYIEDHFDEFDGTRDLLDTRYPERSTRNRCARGNETTNTFLGFATLRGAKHWSVFSLNPVTQFSAIHFALPKRTGIAVVDVGNGEIVMVGGEDYETCALSFFRNLIRRLPPLNVARIYHCACVVDDAIIVCGGWFLWESIKSCEVFSRAENTWRMLPDMDEYRTSAAVVSVSDRRIVVIGGSNRQVSSASVEVFRLPEDFASSTLTGQHTWRRYPSMREARYGHSAIFFEENIIVVGGLNHPDFIEIFPMHTDEGQWVSLITRFLYSWRLHSLIATPDFLYAFVENFHDDYKVQRRQWRRIRNPEMWTSARSPKDIFTSELWTRMPPVPSIVFLEQFVNAPSYYSHIYS